MVKFSDFSEAPAPTPESDIDAASLYNETIVSLREIYKKISQKEELNLQDTCQSTQKLVNAVSLTDEKLIFLTSNIYQEDYLLYHSVNVSILAIKMGLYLKYSKQLVVNLGVLGLLHGIGSSEGKNTCPGELEKEEFIQKFLQFKPMEKDFIKNGLSIISVIDVYESLTHKRAYRERFASYEVLKTIISCAQEVFHPEVVKSIIEVFSIYPLGSKVRLNTEQIAQVVKINQDFPLRPEVIILADSHGKDLEEPKRVDLSSHHNLYIKESVI